MWDAMLSYKGREFNRKMLEEILGWEKSKIDDLYIKFLVRHEFLKVVKNIRPLSYILVSPVSVDCPRFLASGELVTKSNITQNLWRSMRMLSNFTCDELVAHSTTSTVTATADSARFFIYILKKADYIKVIDKTGKGRKERYQLVKNTGPKPPQVLKVKELYDPNKNEIVYREVPDAE